MRNFTIESTAVTLCQRAYCATTGVALRTLQRYLVQIRDNEQILPDKRPKAGRPPCSDTPKVHQARAWFKRYVSLHGVVPHKSKAGCSEVSVEREVPTTVALSACLPVCLLVRER